MAVGVLAQEHGRSYRPVAYLSETLDAVVQGMPACLQALAASALLVSDAEKIVLSYPLTLHPYQVIAILNNLQTQHMTAQPCSGYEVILCATQNLTMKPVIAHMSPTVLLHCLIRSCSSDQFPDAWLKHDCLIHIPETSFIRLNLYQHPFESGIHVLCSF